MKNLHRVTQRSTEVLCLKRHKLEFFKLGIDKISIINFKKPSLCKPKLKRNYLMDNQFMLE